MPHLINTITKTPTETVREQLERAYTTLAAAWLARGKSNAVKGDWKDIASAVRSAAAPIDLTAARRTCSLILPAEERPEEIYHALGHMEVLLAAAEMLSSIGFEPTICAPTQQSSDCREGEHLPQRIPDLGGAGWALEAYGGVCYGNNSKAALDLRTLQKAKDENSDLRTFVAVRGEALVGGWVMGATISARCSKKHGGPWNVSATVIRRMELDQCVVVEVSKIKIGSSQPARATSATDDYYFNFGTNESRDWEEAREYGFLSAGGRRWAQQRISVLEPGDRIWVSVPHAGYVGVGVIEDSAQPIDRFTVQSRGKPVPLRSLPVRAAQLPTVAENPDRAEWVVRVRWLKTVPLAEAFKERGLFGNQNIVALPVDEKWHYTMERLKQHFKL